MMSKIDFMLSKTYPLLHHLVQPLDFSRNSPGEYFQIKRIQTRSVFNSLCVGDQEGFCLSRFSEFPGIESLAI